MIHLVTGRKAEDVHNHVVANRAFPSPLLVWPEIYLDGPVHAEDQIRYMQGVIDGYHTHHTPCTVITMSEVPVLVLVREIEDKKLTPKHVRITYVTADKRGRELRLDEDGEFLDPWPDGFFDWRARLLFGPGIDTNDQAKKLRRLAKARAECDKGWECDKSPTGHCEYSEDSHDNCIHCGEPSERK